MVTDMSTGQGPTGNDVGMSTELGAKLWWNYDPVHESGQFTVEIPGIDASIIRLGRGEAWRFADMLTDSISYREKENVLS